MALPLTNAIEHAIFLQRGSLIIPPRKPSIQALTNSLLIYFLELYITVLIAVHLIHVTR